MTKKHINRGTFHRRSSVGLLPSRSALRLHCAAQVERVDEIQRLDAEKQQVNNAASAVSK